jgi:hypothetical protein
VLRVFVSSIFHDMQAERDELIKRVGPELRRRCERRGVSWSFVDLRWGITEQESQGGGVLSVCLAEIERCRPFFIALLGEAYCRRVPRPVSEAPERTSPAVHCARRPGG